MMTGSLPSDRNFDVVIVGGGVIGSAVAVVERDPAYAASSSSLSASDVRQQFGACPNIEASRFGITFLRNAGELLDCAG
jgi:FAD-dependent oxidoreductase domain-containing protein 1